MFVHLHTHSRYSLLDGLNSPEVLAKRAAALGQPALAITDHGVMYGIVDHYEACTKAGIKPILGIEFYVTSDHTVKDKNDTKNFHLIALAANDVGYRNLIKLATISRLNGFYYKPRIDLELLEQYNEGIIVLSACLAGQIPQSIMANDIGSAKCLTSYFKQLFPDRFFLELQANRIPEQILVNDHLMLLSNEFKVPIVATSDIHFASEADGRIHRSFTILGKNKDDWDATFADAWLKSEEEMKLIVPQEAINNTVDVANMCNVTLEMGVMHLPNYVVPQGYNLDSYVSKLCSDALFAYAVKSNIDIDTYLRRLQYELNTIFQKSLSGYFLIVQDFVRYARTSNIPVGPGRGSAAGSLVSYLLGITKIDPLKYDLLFERFLNPERPSFPDIDIDIAPTGEAQVMQYLYDTYGADNVCNVATYGKLKSRQALKDAGRVLGIDFATVNAFSTKIPMHDGNPYTISQAIDAVHDVKVASEAYPELFELAMEFEDIPKSIGMHAGGVVITPEALTNFVPLTVGKENKVMSQFDKDMLEKQGLLKFDLLKIRTLTAQKYALDFIKANHGIDLDLDSLSTDDPATLALVNSGNTIGVFQLESTGMQRIFKDLNDVTFGTMIDGIALYRPGPLALIPSYISGHNGTRHIDYALPQLEPILQDTYGIILYQEQTMRIATDLAGFSPGQSDGFRKAIGKKKKDVMEKEIHKLVYGDSGENIPGLIANGITEAQALTLADMIEKFASYGFNRSHSAAYAMLAYQMAWLKAHYPVEFMAAQLIGANKKTKFSTPYLYETKRMGIPLLPPDLNKSKDCYSIEGNSIRFGFNALRDVGASIAEELMSAQPFKDLAQLVNFKGSDNRKLNKKVITALALSGALHDFNPDPVGAFIDCMILRREPKFDPVAVRAALNATSLSEHEKNYLGGINIRHNPLLGIAKPTNWSEIGNGDMVSNTFLISEFSHLTTSAGKPMAIAAFETLEGPQRVALFGRTYEKYKDLVTGLFVQATLKKNSRGLQVDNLTIPKKLNKEYFESLEQPDSEEAV